MTFLKFDKAELVNLEYSLSREALRSNRAGSYASTTISGCNTRKYHGLLVCPLENFGGEKHVLLSTLDVTVIQHEKEFNLGIHKYEGDVYIPRGHKYIRDYDAEKGSRVTYRVGGVVLTRESVLVQQQEQILIRFTLEEAHSDTWLRFSPFLAFRSIHKLSKANLYADRHYTPIENGISSCMYEGYPELHMQFSKEAEFVPVPDWYHNIEYIEEQKRGYDFKEDLYVPGYFEVPIKKGESIVFSASTTPASISGLKRKFQSELGMRVPKDSFKNCLLNAAEQFIVRKDKHTEIVAGFPWFGMRGRDTFMSLPGLTMMTDDVKSARQVIDSMVKMLKDGLFPNTDEIHHQTYNSVDAPLWFIWALQQLEKHDSTIDVWKLYKKPLLEIMNAYRNGTSFGIHMLSNGLIYAGEEGIPLTWMDAMANGNPVTLRKGCPVEVNALWYNAVCQLLKWAEKDQKLVAEWKELPAQIENAFVEIFWHAEKKYLADYIDDQYKDFSVRPNQVIAASLEYSPLSNDMKKDVLDTVEKELLTPRGLRTLSPKNAAYKGIFAGDQVARDMAYHQGSVWPWLLEHFVKGYLDVHKRSGVTLVKRIFSEFEEDLMYRGIGSIAELYDGNPPHDAKGAISHASSVAALLRILEMIENYEKDL